MKAWLMKKLDAVPREMYEAYEAGVHDRIRELSQENFALRDVIRLICTRSKTSYYDWACEYCTDDCDKRNGWCPKFKVL